MEDNLQDLSVILSSMSPKIDNVKKTRNKKTNKLALKRSLRRSSIYDKLPHTTYDNVIISGSDTTETCSTSSGTSITNIQSKGSVIEKPSKFDEIKKWVAEVNIERNEIETPNTTTFSEISTIIADHKLIKRSNDTSNSHFAVNSTFVDNGNCIRFHEMFQKYKMQSSDCSIKKTNGEIKDNNNSENKKTEEQITPEVNKDNDSVIIINDAHEEILNFETPIKTQNEINEHEKLLDELYGHSWRANKERVLTYSEPRQKEKVKIKKDILPHTERKPKPSITHKNPYLFNEIHKSQSLIRTLHCTRIMNMTESSPWATKFKDICDTGSSSENLSIESPLKCKMKLTFDTSDSEDYIDCLEFKNVPGNYDKFINKTPRGVKRVDYNKENEQNRTNIEKLTEKESLISCNFQITDESNVDSKTQDENDFKNYFYDITLEKKETLEDSLLKKTVKGGKSSFNDVVKSLKDKFRNDIVFKKQSSEICKDFNGKKTDSYSYIPKERSDDVENNQKTQHVPKSNKNKVQEEENSHKTNSSEDSLLPENKLKNILSIERKTIAPEITKTKKVTKKDTNVKKNDIQSIDKERRNRSKKNVKYFDTSSSDSDSSGESVYINQKQSKSKIEGPLSFLASLSGNTPVDKCDASARMFRSTFKTSKEELAKKLFHLYNEKVFDYSIPNDTLLEWSDKMRGTAGFCYCKKITRRTGAIERKARIVLATKILDSADRLRDTLIHEMCHAATWIVNQISDGHGSYWKAWAAKAMKIFPELPPIKRCHDYAINTKYTYKCSNCGYSIGRHSKSLDVERKRCGYCYGKFEVFINKTTKGGIKAMTPTTPKRQPTGFALFTKENYSDVKKENMNHAEVMKILSKKFSELKNK